MREPRRRSSLGRQIIFTWVLLVASGIVVSACIPGVRVQINAQPTMTPAPASTPAPWTTNAEITLRLRDRPTPTPGVSGYRQPVRTGELFSYLRLAPGLQLSIPEIGVDTPIEQVASEIVDGKWSWKLPRETVAHHLGTANPGEPGNIVLSGHVVTREGGGVFKRLPEIQVGENIVIRAGDGSEYDYVVTSIDVVPADDVSPLRQSPIELLTIITCVPDGVFEHRIIVRAKRV
jgi:LPXTG-site transpeptidase (sortase) family protein